MNHSFETFRWDCVGTHDATVAGLKEFEALLSRTLRVDNKDRVVVIFRVLECFEFGTRIRVTDG